MANKMPRFPFLNTSLINVAYYDEAGTCLAAESRRVAAESRDSSKQRFLEVAPFSMAPSAAAGSAAISSWGPTGQHVTACCHPTCLYNHT